MTRAAVAAEGGAPAPAPDGDPRASLAVLLDGLEALPHFDRDLTEVADQARQCGLTARALGLTEWGLRADLVGADVLRRGGHVADAGRIGSDVLRWATDHDARHLLARAHFLLTVVYRELGDHALSLEHGVLSVDRLPEDAPTAVRIDHLVRLADCLGLQLDATAADRYAEVLRMAEELDDVDRQLLVLNNSAHCASLAGDHQHALAAVRRMQRLTDALGHPPNTGRLDTVGRVLMGLGDVDGAEAALRPGLAPEVLAASPDGDAGAEFLLTYAEVQRARGRLQESQAALDECVAKCREHGLATILVSARREQAELHAATGDHRAAYEELVAYCDALAEQQSEQRDARARTLQALYEATEARQQSRRYRELSLRDPLTGLYNRRHVDEQLPHLLVRGAVEGDLLTIALLDLDHFKRVNDTCSHEVGDEVLRRVASILEGAAATLAEGGFAARLGGEEFVLVLVGDDEATAARRCEEVRRAVAAHPWSEVTGELPVTVSIGVASAAGPTAPTPAELLGQADAHLYQAKSAGRDRVVTSGGWTSAG